MPGVTTHTDRTGLLSSWHANHSSDLQSHLNHRGALALPRSYDGAWSQRLAGLLRESGLTGRGGASFSAAAKIENLRSSARTGTVVVNAMESEPVSDKASVLLECVPHLVLDGADLVASLLGARRIVVCVPADREHTARAVAHALAERSTMGMPSLPVELARPEDRYVSGEESALTSWLDGGAGLPLFRPDKSVPLRIGRAPSLVHNAETLAHIALIARHGADWFRAQGSSHAPGNWLVTVSGCVEHGGVYEVAMGTSLRSILDRSTPSGPVNAVLVGGYGGVWVSDADLDTPLAPRGVPGVAAPIGAGVLVALDDSVCGITESARIAAYLAAESAGQCGPCVHGLPAIAGDLARIADATCDSEVLGRLGRRLGSVEGRGACAHPDGAVRMARSALSVFSQDIAAHLARRPCAHAGARSVMRFPRREEALR
jgi:NADH:ubiquinone oxidoreductase subunit F (NADH-binding)